MEVKIIMDSGREYIVETENVDRLLYKEMYQAGQKMELLKDYFIPAGWGEDGIVYINPSHISSLEIKEE